MEIPTELLAPAVEGPSKGHVLIGEDAWEKLLVYLDGRLMLGVEDASVAHGVCSILGIETEECRVCGELCVLDRVKLHTNDVGTLDLIHGHAKHELLIQRDMNDSRDEWFLERIEELVALNVGWHVPANPENDAIQALDEAEMNAPDNYRIVSDGDMNVWQVWKVKADA